MLANTPEYLECFHGIPMTGAIINCLNTRLDPRTVAFCLKHSGAKILITDTEFSTTVGEALGMLETEERPEIIDLDDHQCPERGPALGKISYDQFLATGDQVFENFFPADEWDGLSLCYTSGTTSDPKGVVLHHRGCYLNAVNNVVSWNMPKHSVYLWTLPMFHCMGWCFPWTMSVLAGTHICLRKVEAAKIFHFITEHKVTHMCGAPIVMTALLAHKGPKTWTHKLSMMTAASAPPAPVIQGMQQLGVDIAHVYGLTEVFGPVTVCEWKEEWNALSIEEQARIKAQQGVRYLALEGLMVGDPETLRPVPKDGQTMGEVFMRGNLVMKGYLKNSKTTEESLKGGWFHTGDLAVWGKDGYIQLKDRSKDIIISGGENVSTLEVESILYKNPKVSEAAVVARPDDKWGETPCAFVELKANCTEDELYRWCQENMPRYMVPRTFVFGPLLKTSTGKVQKHMHRKQAKELTKPTFQNTSKL